MEKWLRYVADSRRLAQVGARLVPNTARWTTAGLTLALAALAQAADAPATFYKDVLPVLQQNCQNCHRPGEIGPMPLLTYDEARPWAKALREAVALQHMPPWHADPGVGDFSNDRRLSESEVKAILSWADNGAPAGNPADAPPPREFVDGWTIGEPDQIFEMPIDFQASASGTIPYQYIKIPSGFTQDRWVQAVEIRPGNRRFVHHGVVYAREPDAEWASKAPTGEFFELWKTQPRAERTPGKTMFSTTKEPEHLQVFVPGADAVRFADGQARLVKAGSEIVFEMHYTPTGKPETDRTQVGIIFAKEPPRERVRTVRINNGSPINIPPGAADYIKESRVAVEHPIRIVALQPHMHYRGKSMFFSAIMPSGEQRDLLSVSKYNFHWQMTYYARDPVSLPVGSILICKAVYDNSANNPDNPDAKAWVKGGLQSEEEMMAGFLEVGTAPDLGGVDVFRDSSDESPKAEIASNRD